MKRGISSAITGILLVWLAAGPAGAANGAMPGAELLPPDAKPGECYARVFVPPTYRTETVDVLVREASEKIEIVPARFEEVEERVLVREASQELDVVPAVYEWVEEKVLVKPASKRIENVPAVYETVTEQVLDRPAHTVWKKGSGPIERVDDATGEILCLVDVPASYKTVTKKILKSEATTREVEVPAEYRTVKKRVLKTPATTRPVEIPAEYKTVRIMKQVAPPQTRTVTIPAEHKQVTRQVLATEGRMAWKPVLCQTNTTPDIITKVQRALVNRGYDPGPVDGILGGKTMAAVRTFQGAKNLPQGGLTMDTLKALGL